MKTRVTTITTIVNSQPAWISSYSTQKTDTSNQDFGWKVVGHTYDEQVRLRDMATMIAAWPKAVDNTVPTVPCLSADGHLLVLSASASRIRIPSAGWFSKVCRLQHNRYPSTLVICCQHYQQKISESS
ncbi:unnamed protein product [Rotaria sordida]|uniref:Uncharacterized protein n=1 Tax=Rotaria sordida TaxID=392033 RepID=A0A819PNQ8_9BILA|nr:unnamed protein product [Rotaria sordida]